MADCKVSNKLPAAAAAAASLPVSKDKEEEVSPPLPAMHDVVTQIKPPQRPLLAASAVLVDVKEPPPASPPPVAVVLPADDDDNKINKKKKTLLRTVWLWALVHAFAFIVAILIADGTPCTKVTTLLYGEILCIAAVVLLVAPPLDKLLKGWTTTTTDRWAANVVDALAWVALAATAGIDYMQVASDRIYLAADPRESYFFVNVVIVSGCLAVDLLLAGFLLCCRFPRRRLGLGEHQGDDDGEV